MAHDDELAVWDDMGLFFDLLRIDDENCNKKGDYHY